MRRSRLISLMVSFTLLSSFPGSNASAADTWLEMQSAHFKAWSNGGEGATRSLLWQLEQIRSAMTTLWPWMKTDLAKPMLVIGVKDEATMRLLAPRYWEQRGAVHPTSVWVTGADQHYMAIRTDLRGDDTQTINPYTSAYFSYANLVLASSFDRDLPLWFTRGLAGVVSNTIVRDNFLLLGPPIPWHLEAIRTRSRLSLKELIAVTRSSPEYTREDGLQRFDAEAWAFVHLLMFGEQGKYQSSINRFSKMLASGTDVNVAFSEAIGRADDLESHFSAYINSSIYSYRRANVDANVSKERMQSRALVPAEVAAGRAALHVAMGRPTEARASIDEARKLDPNSADVFVAEGLLFERNGEREQARSAFSKAAELGSSNAYAYYRSAVLKWPAGPQPDQQVLKEMETALSRATELNSSYGDAYASLAEVKAALRQPAAEVFPILARAVELEPSSVRHRLTAARVFWRYDNLADARKAAQVALSLADTDAERADVQRLLSQLPNDSAGGAAPRQAAGAAVPAADSSRSAPDPNALLASCQRADMSACTTLAPIAEKACADGQKRACVVVAMLQARGSGVPKDEARAYAAFEQLCDGGLLESCAQWAIVLASHPEKPDLAKARQLLTKSCAGGLAQACERLKSLPK